MSTAAGYAAWFTRGWQGFFEVLRIYLSRHAGREAAMIQSTVQAKTELPTVWKKITTALNLQSAVVGDHVKLTSPEPLTAVIERIQQDSRLCALTLRLEAPPGVAIVGTFAWAGQTMASITGYFYGADAQKIAAASESPWKAWLEKTSGISHSG